MEDSGYKKEINIFLQKTTVCPTISEKSWTNILSPEMRDCITNSLFAAGIKASREAATVLVGAVQSYLKNNLKYFLKKYFAGNILIPTLFRDAFFPRRPFQGCSRRKRLWKREGGNKKDLLGKPNTCIFSTSPLPATSRRGPSPKEAARREGIRFDKHIGTMRMKRRFSADCSGRIILVI